jgi:hypothetical protein
MSPLKDKRDVASTGETEGQKVDEGEAMRRQDEMPQ